MKRLRINRSDSMELYAIFSRRIVVELEKRGFKVVKIGPNRKKPGFKVYYFEETPELRQAAQELISK